MNTARSARADAESLRDSEAISHRLLGVPFATLDGRAKSVARHVAQRKHIARDLTVDFDTPAVSRGQRAADAVARFGGSWTFVGLFAVIMASWVAVNATLLLAAGKTFDPYPYILLNLFLSMLAAIQAPIILMSQNRQSEKDRLSAAHDYEVNLKAELEIMLLHEKIDALRETQWTELLDMQTRQLERLDGLVAQLPGQSAPSR
jgi:uncharacterized membrane protein